MTRHHLARFLLACGTSTAALCLAVSVAEAQDTAASKADSGALKEVVVTGSRIQQPGMESPVPVTSVPAAQLTKMAPDTVVSGLTQLPEFYQSQTPNSAVSWFTRGGYGNLDLRGLGINRTLTLVDGRRVVSSTVFGGVDVNAIPEVMISRVETVTGGASAAYGTDAVAGVVNFILNTDYTGMEVNAQGGITSRGDGANYKFSAAFGTDIGEHAHIQLSAERFHQDGIFSYKGRDWYKAWGTIPDSNGMLLIRPHVVSNAATLGGLISTAPNFGSPINGLQFNPDGSYTPLNRGSLSAYPAGIPPARSVGGSADDFGTKNPTLYPDFSRQNFFGYADYDVTPNFKVYTQYIHGEDSSFRYNTPMGSLQGTPTQVTIFQDNAFLPDSLRQIMINNGIQSFKLHTQLASPDVTLRDDSKMDSITGGFKYTVDNDGLFNQWIVNGYYQYGHNKRTWDQVGMRVDRIFAAADAVRDPTTGAIVCRVSEYGNAFPGCQPINLFGQGNASAAALDYVIGNDVGKKITTPLYFAGSGFSLGRTDSYTAQEAKVNRTTLTQHVAEVSASGTVLDGWAGPISAAFGGSYRREHVLQIVRDSTNQSSNHDTGHPVLCDGEAPGLRGVNPPDCANTVGIQYSKVSNIIGTIDVKELFAETQIPLVNRAGIIDSAAVNLAGRWARYSGSGSVWAYKGGLDVQFVGGLRLRGTYSRDVRAANLSERFDKTGGVNTVTDPRYPGDGPINVTIFSGGNPNVSPESGDTFTAGAVFRPDFVPGLSASVDWYHIKIKDEIGQLSPQSVVDGCAQGATNLCSFITRDAATDRIILVGAQYINITKAVVSGVDFEVDYTRDVSILGGGAETLGGRLLTSFLNKNTQGIGSAVNIDRAGQTGIQQSDGVAYSLPDFKATGNLTYQNGGFTAFLQGRYIGSGTIENALVVGQDIESNHVGSAFYLDLRLSQDIKMSNGQTFQIYASVTNLNDKSPPITPYYSVFLGYSQQYNPSLFDVLGRRFSFGVTFKM